MFSKEDIFKTGSAGFGRHARFVSSKKIDDRLQSEADTFPSVRAGTGVSITRVFNLGGVWFVQDKMAVGRMHANV